MRIARHWAPSKGKSMTTRRTGRLRRTGIAVAITVAATAVPLTANGSLSAATTPKKGGTLVIATKDAPVGFCLNQTNSNASEISVHQAQETLFEQRDDGKTVPFLAESASAIASLDTGKVDYRTWRVKIRPNIKFSDGTPLNADNVILNITAWRGRVAGVTGAGDLAVIANGNWTGARKVDDLTVDITFDLPIGDIGESLYGSGRQRIRSTAWLSQKAADQGTAKGCKNFFDGTGPFMMESISSDKTEIVLVRNPNYWRKDKNGVQLPYLDKIIIKAVSEGVQRVNGLKTGDYDVAWFTGELDTTQYKTLSRMAKNKKMKLVQSKPEFFPQIFLNTSATLVTGAANPFSNLDCRKAVIQLFDRKSYVAARGNGVLKANDTVLGSVTPGYTKAGMLTFDKTAGNASLDKCLTAIGKTSLEFGAPHDTALDAQKNMEFIATMLATNSNNRIKLNLRAIATNTVILQYFGNAHAFQQFQVLEGPGMSFNQLFLKGKISSSPRAAATFKALGQPLNLLSMSKHTFENLDLLYEKALANPNAKAAAKDFQAAMKIWQENALSIPTWSLFYFVAGGNQVNGMGELQLLKGGQAKKASNWGLKMTNVWLSN